MIYYNQYNFKTTPYWSAAHPSATIASAGCGVCCASMVLSVFGIDVKPPKMAEICQKINARVSTGTDMGILSKYLKDAYKLNLSKYDDVSKARKEIQSGAVMIANVGGDRTGYKGVFSNGGHYIVIYGEENGQPVIYDPGFYQGKYDSGYRSSRVKIGKNNKLFADWSVLDKDCQNRSPRYYVFSKPKEVKPVTVAEGKKILKEKAGLSDKTIDFLYNYRYGDDLIVKLAEAMSK